MKDSTQAQKDIYACPHCGEKIEQLEIEVCPFCGFNFTEREQEVVQ